MKYKETINGPMIFPENDTYIGRALDYYGEAHQLEIDFLEKLVSKGDVVIDVGANIGIITIPMAKKVGSEGYVLSLEAHSMLFYTLCGNIALNNLNHVQVFNRAAADKTGSMFYFPHLDFSKSGNFGNMKLAGLLNAKDDQGKIYDNPVTAVAIDDLGISNPKLIKIDVEGMEPVVLNGLRKTIKRAKPILYVEFTQNWKYILDYLKSVDYEWALHETPLFNPNNFNSVKDDIMRHPDSGVPLVSGDLVCWHKSKKIELDDPYIVDLDNSDNPRHIEMREIRDEKHESTEFTIASD
jgi:FkbM family methyltransferase